MTSLDINQDLPEEKYMEEKNDVFLGHGKC
jgi:hypothetical protein